MSITSVELPKEKLDKLNSVIESIPDILKKTDNPVYDEIYGYRINEAGKEYVDEKVRNEIIHKFLAADDYDVEACKTRLVNTLNWRSKFKPLSAAFDETFDEELKLLGAVTKFNNPKSNLKTVTWNFYGNVKTPEKLFKKFGKGEDSAFLRWRIGLMERALLVLDFTSKDNNKIAQVHDYKGVSMLRMEPNMKAATKQIISIFGDNYPELLLTKFFINVPTFMSWVFGFFGKLGIISQATLLKFQVLSGGDMSEWFGELNLPTQYNGGKKTEVTSLFDVEKLTHQTPTEYAKFIFQNSAVDADNLSVE